MFDFEFDCEEAHDAGDVIGVVTSPLTSNQNNTDLENLFSFT